MASGPRSSGLRWSMLPRTALTEVALCLVVSPNLQAGRRHLRALMYSSPRWAAKISTIKWDDHWMGEMALIVGGEFKSGRSDGGTAVWAFNGRRFWRIASVPVFHETADAFLYRARLWVVGGSLDLYPCWGNGGRLL